MTTPIGNQSPTHIPFNEVDKKTRLPQEDENPFNKPEPSTRDQVITFAGSLAAITSLVTGFTGIMQGLSTLREMVVYPFTHMDKNHQYSGDSLKQKASHAFEEACAVAGNVAKSCFSKNFTMANTTCLNERLDQNFNTSLRHNPFWYKSAMFQSENVLNCVTNKTTLESETNRLIDIKNFELRFMRENIYVNAKSTVCFLGIAVGAYYLSKYLDTLLSKEAKATEA